MNLYVHFPFCRSKCTYCALHSRAGSTKEAREEYVSRLVKSLDGLATDPGLKTLYFGGGSPALCDLEPLLAALAPMRADDCEFTVELHPLDVTRELLVRLKSGGVNRISMGVQSLDDGILSRMRRGYTFREAERAFALVREVFDNAGIDLIVGYPGEVSALTPRHARLAKWGLSHCSVYSLILEPNSILGRQYGDRPRTDGDRPRLPDDDTVLNRIAIVSRFLEDIGLKRYEISNYAVPGRACRHNLAVWHGEDYMGLGDGAHGRLGLLRTENWWGWGQAQGGRGQAPVVETVSKEKDVKERKIFTLRTRDGLDLADTRWGQAPAEWGQALDGFVAEGLLTKAGRVYRLTERGTEVCDSIMAELV